MTASVPMSRGLLVLCRAGFESDCAAEAADRASAAGIAGHCEARHGAGWMRFVMATPTHWDPRTAGSAEAGWIFPRQVLLWLDERHDLPASDRVSAIVAALPALPSSFAELRLDYPDTNDGKALSRFCRRFHAPLRGGLEAAGVRFGNRSAPDLHLFFTNSSHVQFCVGLPGLSGPWPNGIPRLRMPADAPSRSTLKLEEALLTFKTADDGSPVLRPGMRAVDLGASPGGWTYQLVRRGLHVTAVDNGDMDERLLNSGLVAHVRADAFRFRPANPVDLLVCDVVEQPSRIARLIGQWFARGDCSEAIFNLKLPMKQRYRNTRECLDVLCRSAADRSLTVRCRQLYHDREEVTVHARLTRFH